MKTRVMGLAAIAMGLIVLACPAGCGSSGSEPGQYHSKPYGFSITFPENWEQLENVMGAAVVARSAREDSMDAIQENVNVVVEKLRPGMDLKQYADESRDMRRAMLADVVEVEEAEVTLGGRTAMRAVYSHRMKELHFDVLVYLVPANGRGYVIRCTTEKGKLAQFREQFEQIAGTFRIEKEAAAE